MTEVKNHINSTRKEVLQNFAELIPFPNIVHGDNGHSFFYGTVESFEIKEINLGDIPFNVQVDLYLPNGNIKTFYAGATNDFKEFDPYGYKVKILPILKPYSELISSDI